MTHDIDVDELKRRFAVLNANRHLALYRKTGDGLLIWRAYLEFRHFGLPVPESLLKKLDQVAGKLEHASSAKEVAAALEMGSADGPAGATLAAAHERQRDIVEHVYAAVEAAKGRKPRRRKEDIFEETAKEFGTPFGNVKKLYYQWMREAGLGRKK